MKHKKYLNQFELMKLWEMFNTDFSIKSASKEIGVTYSCGRRWINDIQNALAGEKITRSKGVAELKAVVKRLIKEKDEKGVIEMQTKEPTNGVHKVAIDEPIMTYMTTEQKVDHKFEELKAAIVELALEMANEKTQAIVEQAQKSNVIGLIKKGWTTRSIQPSQEVI